MRFRGLVVLLGLASCGGDDAVTKLDAAVGADAPADSASGDAPPISAEGFASVYVHERTNASSPDLEAYFHAWAPGTATPIDTFRAYYPDLGSGMPLAIGACTTLGSPPFTAFTSLVAGANLALAGPSAVALTGPDTVGYYYGFNDTSAAAFIGPTLSMTAGAGSTAVGGPGTLPLGTIASIAIASEPVTCSRASACVVGATVGTSDELYVRILGANICRLDPTAAPAIPTAGFANVSDGASNFTLYSVRRSTQRMGGGSYEVVLVHERNVGMTVTQ